MVSLTLADVTDANRLLIDADMTAIRDARPGDIIDLQVRAISLNVKVKHDCTAWSRHYRLAVDDVVIPCII